MNMEQHISPNLPPKKQQIIATAAGLFQRFGIRRVSVEEICQKASVSKMTFYKYFKNKNELVKYLWNNWFDEALIKFDDIRRRQIPFTEKLLLMLKLKEESVKNLSYELALDYFNAVPEMRDFFEGLTRKSINRFLDFIREAQQKGEVRAEMRPKFFLAFLDKIKELVNDRELVESYPSYKDFVMEINNFMFYGILPRPGSKEK